MSVRTPRKINSEMITTSASDSELITVKRADVMELMEILRRFSDTLPDDAWAAIYGAAVVLVPPESLEDGEEVEFASNLTATDNFRPANPVVGV